SPHGRQNMKKTAIACVALASALYGAGSLAGGWGHHHGHGHHHKSHSSVRLYLGSPLPWLSTWYRPHYYSYPRTVVVERQPQVYVQRTPAAAPAAQQDYWYYCPDSRTYYPYAQSCPSPWLQVVPQTTPR